MRQRLSVESPTQSSAIAEIHPKLQRALEHIDVRLDEELTRYRRQKAGLSVMPAAATGWQRKSVTKSVQLPLDQTNDRPPLPQLTGGKQPALTDPSGKKSTAPDQSKATAGFTPPSDVDLFTYSGPTTSGSDPELSPESGPESGHEPMGDWNLPAPIEDDDDRFSLADNAAQLDDYLESSEELLKSLASQKAQVQVEKSFLDHLVTPLGIGSMFMLLLSSAMLGYVIMNPSSLTAFTHLWPTRKPTPQPASTAATTEPTGPIANSPPLDTQEFVQLGLDSLTTLTSRPSGRLATVPKLPTLNQGKPAVPAAKSAAKAGTPSVSLTGPIIPVQPPLLIPAGPPIPTRPIPAARSYGPAPSNYTPPTNTPARSYSAPARSYEPAPAQPKHPSLPPVTYTPVPPAPLPTIKVAPAESYQEPGPAPQATTPANLENSSPADVGVRFTGDQQLEQVQKSAPGAYLENTENGAYIKVPLDKVQDLQNQGIPVEPIPSK
jgi:hypothetical protein